MPLCVWHDDEETFDIASIMLSQISNINLPAAKNFFLLIFHYSSLL